MTNQCDGCLKWTVARQTLYADGSKVDTFRAPEGKGHCEALDIDTTPDFGCTKHEAAPEGFAHVYVSQKGGAPWQHWTMIACPDCSGAGSSNDRPDDRCAGTGKVRRYDDGFIGDERTRMHPKERELAGGPKCGSCGRAMDAGWVACPSCGWKIEKPAEPEVISALSTT
jgi:hypothetical protein